MYDADANRHYVRRPSSDYDIQNSVLWGMGVNDFYFERTVSTA